MPTRVLLIDDNPADVTLLRIVWRDVAPNLDVAWAGSLHQGLARLEQFGADVAVLDVRLPGISWPAQLVQLRRAFPAVPVVVLSGHTELKYRETALAMGASAYLVKGMDTCGQLAEVIAGIAKKGEAV